MQTEITAPQTMAAYRELERQLEEAEKIHAAFLQHSEAGKLYGKNQAAVSGSKARLDALREAFDSATQRLQAKIKSNAESLLADLDAAAAHIGDFLESAEPVHKVVQRLREEGHPLVAEVGTAAHGVKILTNAAATLKSLAAELRAAQV